MGAAPPTPTEDSIKQGCCLGMLYYSAALRAEGRRPVCLGIPHKPGSPVALEDRSQLTDGYGDFKFVCIGYSVFELQRRAAQAAQAAGAQTSVPPLPPKLPYCEGIEAIMAAPVEGGQEGVAVVSSSEANAEEAAAAAAAAPAAAAAAPASRRPAPAAHEQQQRRQSLLGSLLDQLGSHDREDNPVTKFAEKFVKVAHRNLDRMKVTLSTAGTALKSLVDKDSED